MAWMLLVGALENLQQELGIGIRTRTGKQALRRSSRISLFAKILGKPGVLSTKQEDYVFLNISLIDVYDHLVQVLIDGDPQSLLAVFPSCES